jgi:16S rRNA (guanine527-N7)-methyltransferase
MVTFSIEEAIEKQLAHYQSLIHRYYHSMDLMSPLAVTRLDEKIAESLDFLDAICSIAPRPSTLLDIGSGVGLPAIPLAIALPYLSIYCVERRKKRARFLTLVCSQLGLSNVNVVEADVRMLTDIRADVVTALAVGSLTYLYGATHHLLASPATLVTKKGHDWQQEISELELLMKVDVKVETFHVKHGTLLALTY